MVLRAGIDPNHHKGMVAVDETSGDPFAVEGSSTTGSINVNLTNTVASAPSSPTVTSVGDTTSSTTLLAAKATRKEAEFFNTSTAVLYLLKGTGTASSTNFTVSMNQGDYYTTDYTGQVNGVWASDAGGSVLITESE